jgi:hypothetical protein
MRACAQTKPVIMRTHTHGYISVGGRSLCVAVYCICRLGQAWSFPPRNLARKPAFLCSRSDIRRVLSFNLELPVRRLGTIALKA